MKGKRFPWLDLYCTGFTNDVRWFLYCAKSDSVPEHGEEWGYELLTNGPTRSENGFLGHDHALFNMAYYIYDQNPDTEVFYLPCVVQILEVVTEDFKSATKKGELLT